MILKYNEVTGEIVDIVADQADATFQTAVLTQFLGSLGANEDAGILVDDSDVLEQPFHFLAVETTGDLSSTERKKSVEITVVTDPIEMNEETTVTVQLKDKDLVDDSVPGITVTFTNMQGVISPSSFVTDASGQNPDVITYKPGKFFGEVAFIMTATGDYQQQLFPTLTINAPSNSTNQQWLQPEDMKDGSIIADKQSSKGNVAIPGKQVLYFVEKAFKVAEFDVSLQNINSIVADEYGNLYVNGFDGPGATNPVVKKINSQTGQVTGTYTIPVGEENLANRFDGMAYDGAHIWVAGANHLLQLDLDMTLDTDHTVAADGNLQFVASDGEFIWFQLRGGTDGDKDKIWKLDPTDATPVASAVRIDYRTGDIDTTVREIKQVAMDNEYIYIPGTGPSTDWDRIKRSDNSVLHRGSGSNGSFGMAVDNRDLTIYIAGGVGTDQDVMTMEITSPTLTILANGDAIDKNFWDLLFDGTNLWVITAIDSTSTNRQFVRKTKFNPAAGTIDLAQSFDITTAVDPTAMAFDGKYLYVVGFAATAINITKIAVGK